MSDYLFQVLDRISTLAAGAALLCAVCSIFLSIGYTINPYEFDTPEEREGFYRLIGRGIRWLLIGLSIAALVWAVTPTVTN